VPLNGAVSIALHDRLTGQVPLTNPSQPAGALELRRQANLIPALYHNPCEHKAIPHFIVKAPPDARLPNLTRKRTTGSLCPSFERKQSPIATHTVGQ
jgi:hypothetical protein